MWMILMMIIIISIMITTDLHSFNSTQIVIICFLCQNYISLHITIYIVRHIIKLFIFKSQQHLMHSNFFLFLYNLNTYNFQVKLVKNQEFISHFQVMHFFFFFCSCDILLVSTVFCCCCMYIFLMLYTSCTIINKGLVMIIRNICTYITWLNNLHYRHYSINCKRKKT